MSPCFASSIPHARDSPSLHGPPATPPVPAPPPEPVGESGWSLSEQPKGTARAAANSPKTRRWLREDIRSALRLHHATDRVDMLVRRGVPHTRDVIIQPQGIAGFVP